MLVDDPPDSLAPLPEMEGWSWGWASSAMAGASRRREVADDPTFVEISLELVKQKCVFPVPIPMYRSYTT